MKKKEKLLQEAYPRPRLVRYRSCEPTVEIPVAALMGRANSDLFTHTHTHTYFMNNNLLNLTID